MPHQSLMVRGHQGVHNVGNSLIARAVTAAEQRIRIAGREKLGRELSQGEVSEKARTMLNDLLQIVLGLSPDQLRPLPSSVVQQLSVKTATISRTLVLSY